jgi:hypothetical protein
LIKRAAKVGHLSIKLHRKLINVVYLKNLKFQYKKM